MLFQGERAGCKVLVCIPLSQSEGAGCKVLVFVPLFPGKRAGPWVRCPICVYCVPLLQGEGAGCKVLVHAPLLQVGGTGFYKMSSVLHRGLKRVRSSTSYAPPSPPRPACQLYQPPVASSAPACPISGAAAVRLDHWDLK